jgi:hypothetical protein
METALEKFVTEFVKRSNKFIADTELWEDYPKDPAYFAVASVLKDVVVPSLLLLKKGDKNEHK